MLNATWDLPDAPLVIYAVHLKSNRGDATTNRLRRLRAMEQLEADWKRQGLDPERDRIVILGDFNTSLHDPQFEGEATLQRLKARGFQSAAEGLPRAQSFTVSGSGGFPPNDFDHIYVSPAQAKRFHGPPPWMTVRPFVPAASDHAMLVIDLP
jgi:endonuclease/exonuclease/phosphatase family metal-dependent hydrolase